jgi:hypothetical protein
MERTTRRLRSGTGLHQDEIAATPRFVPRNHWKTKAFSEPGLDGEIMAPRRPGRYHTRDSQRLQWALAIALGEACIRSVKPVVAAFPRENTAAGGPSRSIPLRSRACWGSEESGADRGG